MLRPWIWMFSLSLFILPASLASAQDVRPPKTIAFVVGVQHYDDPDLDKLRYTVKDAQDVFDRLKAVTDLDLERSRLLLADPKATDEVDPNDPDWVIRKNKLGLQEIQDELANLLELVKNDETVVFYFGGHGTVQAQEHLLFLPSDYSRRPQRRFWRYSNIIDDIRGRINDRHLRNVSVVFFANMCGAGTAAGDMSAEEDLNEEFVKEWLANNTLGFERFALFPASAPNQNTFEDPEFKSSVFAHYLVEGLRGGAATDGVITAESLFGYLDEKIQDDLPKDPKTFDPKIRIGVTRELEGRALYLNGLSLLSDALDTDDPLFWRLAQRNLQEAVSFTGGGPLGVSAALKLAQVRAAQGADLSELADTLTSVTRSAAAESGVNAAATRLLEAAQEAPPQHFAAVIVTSEPDASVHPSAQRWRSFLEQLPGHSSAKTVTLPSVQPERQRWKEVLSSLVELKKEYKDFHLVFVYTGVAGGQQDEWFPFGVEAFHAFIKQWAGPTTIIYDAPFGGFLKREFDAGRFGDISLVLSAQETNGITFRGGSPEMGVTDVLIQMLKSGVTDANSWTPFTAYRSKFPEGMLGAIDPTQQKFYEANSWVLGTPSIDRSRNDPSPVFPEATKARREASAGLGPVRRLAPLIATGCDVRVDAGCTHFAEGPVEKAIEINGVNAAVGQISMFASPDPVAVFDLLKMAALLDYSGDVQGAFAAYNRFLRSYDEAYRALVVDQPATEADLREQARESVDRVTNQVRDRLDGLQGKFTRQIWLILASAAEYKSPLVPDLADAGGDLRAWESALRAAQAGEVPVNVRPIDTASRTRLLETLRQALAEVGDDDLVLFLFSGRGIEIAGERYLAPADVLSGSTDALVPPELLAGMPRESSPGELLPTTDELISIAEIAEQARGRWFVGIYDAQFTQPVLEAWRVDGLLDKHLNSVRPSPSEATFPPTPATPELERFLAGASGFPEQHVHMWWEGALTERLAAPANCKPDLVKGVRSPMTAALVAALLERPFGTYRDWIGSALEHPCLGSPTSFGLVAQGSVDLPRFASGKAATQIPYFLGVRERRDTNLHAADAVTEVTSNSGDHPLFALSRAAILVALVEFARSAPSEAELEQSNWLAEALGLLGRLWQSEKVREAGLETEVLDLYARALVLNGQDDQARNFLLGAQSPQLASTTLQERLIDLTEAELQQSPTGILEATGAKLADLDASVSPGVSARFEALSSLYEAPRGQYRIVTPPGSSP